MRATPAALRTIAIAMAAQAGFVDALGFLEMRGRFVSFMSGNSTRFAVDFAAGLDDAFVAGRLIAAFVAGVVAGSLLRRLSRHRPVTFIQSCVVAGLTVAAAIHATAGPSAAVLVMAATMGLANAAFARNGEVSIGVTYVTGALVKAGQGIATALLGGDRWGWTWHAGLWLGLVAGAAIGALAYREAGLAALAIAVGYAAVLAIGSVVLPQSDPVVSDRSR